VGRIIEIIDIRCCTSAATTTCFTREVLVRGLVAARIFIVSLLLTPAIGLGSDTSPAADDTARSVTSVLEMRQHNVVLQQWELSCAAAALATVLRYQHGVPVTERSVALGLINRQEYLKNPELVRLRQGFSLLDLKRFVDELGFEGIGLSPSTTFSSVLPLSCRSTSTAIRISWSSAVPRRTGCCSLIPPSATLRCRSPDSSRAGSITRISTMLVLS